MKNKLFFIFILLIIPLFSLVVTYFCEMSLNFEMRNELRKTQNRELSISIKEINNLTVRDLILISEQTELKSLRSEIALFDLINYSSKIIIISVIFFLIVLFLLGWIASLSRFVLLFFIPSYYLSVILLTAFTIINGALLVTSLYLAESYLLGRFHFIIIGLIGIGAVIGAYNILQTMFISLRKNKSSIQAFSISKEKYPTIWNLIESISAKFKSEPPNNIIVGLEPNFFVTESDMICINQELRGRTLYISLPLLRLLNKEQFIGIIGHEFAHFIGKDTKYSRYFYPIYRSLYNVLNQFHNSSENSLALIPTELMFTIFLESFSKAENMLNRERELRADKIGVDISSKLSFASSLTKTVIFSLFWNSMQSEISNTLSKNKMIINISDYFATSIPALLNDLNLDDLSSYSVPHPYDSHPPLSQRIEQIGFDLKLTINEFITIDNENAIEIIDNYDVIERELSEVYQSILLRNL